VPQSAPVPAPGDDLRAASRAVKDALSNLSRTLTQGIAGVSADVTREIAEELNDASRDLARGLDVRGRRASKADETRAGLITGARKVFAEKGYEAASVADLAAAAGYTKGALYAHFESKEALFLAVIDDAQAETCELGPEALRLASTGDLADIMLSLEAYLYALRHPGQRDAIAPYALTSLDQATAEVHRWRTGAAGDPTPADRDTALAIAALTSLGSILARILPTEADIASAVSRISEQLLR
jgi:AcrR family transcriptional regulator